jgi:hypothetical protein
MVHVAPLPFPNRGPLSLSLSLSPKNKKTKKFIVLKVKKKIYSL